MIGTFCMVLFFTMLKEAFEDYQRYKSDNELNNSKTRIFQESTGIVKEVLWADVRAGDIIQVLKDEEIPADILLCNAPQDVVFVSTMNLDGETNLKERVLGTNDVKDVKMM